ncbi:MAG TPA: DEAD/DEAH box helicase [Solirubrobacteraceae bacterium]|jgi:SWI/SNF-related matrix-associated actin-dependent regulator 1 of chromatin subfamily A|nr:DEAD/DEAH box helicase [Solirubrobacteraceae bacterium]
MDGLLQASFSKGEAVLRFPYDDDLRRLLRAIPGRRWDPEQRAWIVPLDPERAQAVTLLLRSLPRPPLLEEPLARALERQRALRSHDECVLDVARPNESWWLTFATDRAPEIVARLLEHPDAQELPTIGRALIPLDEHAGRLVDTLPAAAGRLRLSEDAAHALTEVSQRPAARPGAMTHDVELRRDRRKQHWVLIAAEHAPLARVLAARAGLRALEGPEGTFAIAAVEHDAHLIAELLDQLEMAGIDPRAQSWLARATTWHGTIDVAGSPEEPVFLLLGDHTRLPPEIRERAISAPGGATVPLTLDSWRQLEQGMRGFLSTAARRCIAALKEGRPAPPAVLEISTAHEDPTFVLAPGHDTTQLEAFGALSGATPPRPSGGARAVGARGRDHGQLPAIRADPFCVEELDRFLSERDIWIEPDALVVLQEIREQHSQAAGLVALSCATDAAVEVSGLGGELKPFQRAGVSYLLAQRRAFLADEQGLGKTIEALATLEADGAYPAVVVCPASLKLNWMRELERWLPGRSAQALSGTGMRGRRPDADDAREDTADEPGPPGGAPIPPADITVVNYDILAARAPALAALAPRALVLDESHYCKNAAAKRTQAVARLAGSVPADGLVLALTGTPVMNRPPELISQLRILGRLADFGSGAQFGRRFRGPDAHVRLHWHLRSRCFVRRLKADVLPQLPPKTRTVVPVELDNEAEYRLAETDVIAWLRSRPLDLGELDAKIAAALRAERLVRLNALKMLAARGKLHAALAWIHDFCSSGERLVVFARHREVQRAVIERFPHALHILGEDSHAARDASVSAFQAANDSENQLIVCSLEVAGQGLTLTQASNVAFLELDWTPAKHDQAEDRCHRIGQQDAVNAWYLLAAGTIDETMANLLERKRAIINAVTDGREEDDEGIVDALVRELAGEPYRHLRAVA